MFKFVKKGVFMLLVASLVMGVTSCKDDDPDYENVTPPVVEVAPSQIAGVVSAMNGDAIKDATVKATTGGKDVTATTDANGSYVLENVAKGTYTMEVAAEGKQVATGSLTVSFSFFAAYRFIGRHKSGSSTMQAARPSAMGLAVWTVRARSPSVSSSQTNFRMIFMLSAPAYPRISGFLRGCFQPFHPSCGLWPPH